MNRFLKKSPEVARSPCDNPDDTTQTERISVRITLRPIKHNNHMNSPKNIPVRISPIRIHYGRGISLDQNGCNLVSIKISKNVPPSTVKVPKFMLTNVRSLAPKMDEISYFMLHNHVDLAFITETWLGESIRDSIIHIPGYTVFRRDRIRDNHSGVCIYVQADQLRKFKQISHIICCDDHEILWLHICPNRLPRGYSSIIVGVIYHPPSDNDALIRDHLLSSLTKIESEFPNCGIILAGDFNRLNINFLLKHFRLKQLVKVSTRNNATLDLLLTNLHEYYCPSLASPSFGLSDHNTIVVTPKIKVCNATKGEETRLS